MQRLAEAGVADWRVFSRHRYSKLTSETDIENAAIKVAEVCKEGLAAEDVEWLFQQQTSPWTSILQEVFQPNMAYLRGLLKNARLVRAPYEPALLTPLGRLVRNQPSDMGIVLSRSPALIGAVEGWGLQLRRAVEALVKLGYDVEAAETLVFHNPELLYQDLEGPVQQEKMQWVRQELGWPVTKMLSQRVSYRSLCRMASRLSFMRHLGLPDPGSLAYIGMASEPVFLAKVGKAAGREVSAGEFAEWVAA
ncbi:hypothetical protein N2152v2_001460 [Parachlorella kessleri]